MKADCQVAQSTDSPSKLISSLRSRINESRRRSMVMQDLHDWHRLCSAMDAIQDTEDAIQAYEVHPPTRSTGERYLLLYGLLQAMFVQQDALKSIALALKINFEEDKELKEIRETRNETVGHPTEIRRKKVKYYATISQTSVTKSHFQYFKSTPNS